MNEKTEPFFIGWAAPPAALRPFLISFAISALAFAAILGWLVAATQPDPGDGAFRGPTEVVGTLVLDPYPVVHVEQSEGFDPGDALILSGPGKIGVRERSAAFDGQRVTVRGARLLRGDLTGLQLRGNASGLEAAEGPVVPVPVEDLGRWRLTGEICDGKCLMGAMRPGTGLAHRACANLCIAGGVPPVFVSTAPAAGAEFFLMAGPDGGPVPEDVFRHTALLVEVEGHLERHGTLAVFRLDPETLRLAQ
ncbi:MAG: hypothetical protein AAFU80_11365 [Pseudomonadota bacterium]